MADTLHSRKSGADQPCVLPGDSAWIWDAQYLDEQVLDIIAGAARADAAWADGGRYVLAPVTYEIAAGLIGHLAADLRLAAVSEAHLLSLPAWELEALRAVLQVFRRAVAGEPETADVRALLHDLCDNLVDRPVAQVVGDLERVVVVLSLDIPAVRTLATALILGSPRDLAVHNAYDQIRAAWVAAGIRY
ncbi:hypothetical protein [Streptomyces mordarskii]|uniref:Uncharacterized protein n=1 Tax=Streptomyces mordarskii TaxID=1226758 RepID=A0ABN1EUF2_9ACTN